MRGEHSVARAGTVSYAAARSPRPASRFSMTSLIDHPNGTSLRARYGRRRRVVILAAAGLLATGAFLLWGPVGLGNGPLGTGPGYGSGAGHAGGPLRVCV